MSDQLSSGSFVRGLWYFFGIVVAAGIFAGTAGLGIGYVAGVVWEQIHRHRRQVKLKQKALAEASLGSTKPPPPSFESEPTLRLVSLEASPIPALEGKTLTSVRFKRDVAELEFGAARIEIRGQATILCAGQRFRFPESGSRDALCSLIGDRVDAVRLATADRIEVHFESGCEIVTARSVIAVA